MTCQRRKENSVVVLFYTCISKYFQNASWKVHNYTLQGKRADPCHPGNPRQVKFGGERQWADPKQPIVNLHYGCPIPLPDPGVGTFLLIVFVCGFFQRRFLKFFFFYCLFYLKSRDRDTDILQLLVHFLKPLQQLQLPGPGSATWVCTWVGGGKVLKPSPVASPGSFSLRAAIQALGSSGV